MFWESPVRPVLRSPLGKSKYQTLYVALCKQQGTIPNQKQNQTNELIDFLKK